MKWTLNESNPHHSSPRAVYFHIPFCEKKCFYCDFNTFVTRGDEFVWEYLGALQKEMEQTVAETPPREIRSIYVGGGTPTYLDADQMSHFLQMIHRFFSPVQPGVEITVEANPGTTDLEKLRVMYEGGVNRISFGVQSFDDALLREIGRIHDRRQVYESIENARRAGFENISVDLMFGLPRQTLSMFENSLEEVIVLEIPHISAYSLKVEENTIFYRREQQGQLPLPSEDEERIMYDRLKERLDHAGFRQYEISNFARPGYESIHNMTYWCNEPYYGIGAGAHGYVGGVRHVNAGPLKRYIRMVEEGLPRVESREVSCTESMEDFMIMGLRLLDGVEKERFHRWYGCSLDEVFGGTIRELVDRGLLEENEIAVRLSREGIPLGNEVFARFLGNG